MNRAGSHVSNLTGDATYKSYRPAPLPPKPAIEVDEQIATELASASQKLAELDTIARHIPDVSLFLSMYIRKEALISSQIEGTQCTLDDILAPDVEQNANLDVAEVLSYVKAVQFAVEHRDELPLCNRFLRDVHKVLLSNVRGADKEPGEFRRSQNWIGPAGCSLKNARYIPPNVEDMQQAMSNLEKYINAEDSNAPLIRAALIHYQFETIHPFLDGNGRIGRLLILLCLMEWGLLHSPILYVSYFLKKNQWEYYGKLGNVRTSGNYEQWVLFFLEAVHHAAADAVENILLLRDLQQKNLALIQSQIKNCDNALKLFQHITAHPIISIKSAIEALGVSRGTAQKCVNDLVELGILKETTKQARNRIFAYEDYLAILRKDT